MLIKTTLSLFAASLFYASAGIAIAAAEGAPAPDAQVAPAAPAGAEAVAAKLLRYPDIHGDTVVFCYGGDIWKTSAAGGTAVRLTAHPGQELFPRFSPDGQWIAFTGQYDGDEQVYVIPVAGGVPRQLTFYPSSGPMSYGYDNLVYGWTPDGKNILFRSLRDANSVTELGTLYTVPFEGGLPKKVGMPTAGAGEFSPDGTKIVYSPIFRDFRSWKRYQGGMVQHLQIFDLKTRETKRLDKNPRTEREPIWIGEKIFFTSDRTGTMNIFEYDTQSGKVVQRTHEKQWDVRWSSGDKDGQIVYELGGELIVYNTRASRDADRFRKLAVHVPHDGLAMRPVRINVGGHIESYSAAPGGKRLAIAARGDLFSVPVEKGYPRNLTNSSNAHEREPIWSHDGKLLASISDKSGEDQIYIQDAKGEQPSRQITTTFKSRLANLTFSPDGRYLAVTDSSATLWLVPLKNGKAAGEPFTVVTAENGGTPTADWSPCSGYIAYTLPNPQEVSQLYIYEVATKKTRLISGPLFDVQNPAWDPAGNYLYFLSRREFAPQFSSVEWNFAGARDIGIFALALRKNVPNPFGPQFDDETTPVNKTDAPKAAPKPADKVAPKLAGKAPSKSAAKVAQGKKAAKAPAAKSPAPRVTKIDWDGLDLRVVRVPVPFENYSSLSATDKFLFFVRSAAHFNGREAESKSRLIAYDLKERKEILFAADAGAYTIAPDFSKIIYRSEGALRASEPKPGAKSTVIKTDSLYADSIPAEEWAEMFNETWRKYRDFFYVRNMHGYDWEALGQQYRALLPHVAHRSDLTYILREMVSELNIGHAYVMGGEFIQPRRPVVGLPGCIFELDEKANRYKIAKIYRGSNEEPKYRSPLTEIGVNAKVGDYVLAIDGIELTGAENPYRVLQHRANPVTLTLNAKPELKGAHKTTYVPLPSEQSLRYLDFVLTSHERVAKATNGRAGYLHIPNMGGSGAYEFLKWYYPQLRKEGLVIDVRTNGGGNISQWIIMRLNQKLLGTRFGGPNRTPDAYPGNARHGHQVCLINETAGSDGDIFPHFFRVAGLGPLIGKRTWGGVVGISGVGPLLDGGTVYVPMRGSNDIKGNWIIEGKGVQPDIEVENDPKSMIEGVDPQLERGIEELIKHMDAQPKKWPERPADPVKTK
ncbi:MAG: PDZ domain-containing protein [Puniceicoccales bacterium]|jgi:tricorn protease|nr:PDZ domain-containing protein [Puniceicoccales bacterium]